MRLISFCLLMLSFITTSCAAEERRYRVEMVVFENPYRPARHNAKKEGRPYLEEALPFAPIADNKLVLKDIKKRIAKRHPALFHAAWIQTVGKRDAPTKVKLIGGKNLDDTQNELEGVVQIFVGKKNVHINTDLALFKILKDEPEAGVIQSAHWNTTTPVMLDEINFLTHRQYGMIIMVTPEVTRKVKISG